MNQTVNLGANLSVQQPIQIPNNSAVLERLLREVRIQGIDATSNRYDRVHNRHNR